MIAKPVRPAVLSVRPGRVDHDVCEGARQPATANGTSGVQATPAPHAVGRNGNPFPDVMRSGTTCRSRRTS